MTTHGGPLEDHVQRLPAADLPLVARLLDIAASPAESTASSRTASADEPPGSRRAFDFERRYALMLQREDWPIGEDDCQSCGIPGQAPRCESCVRWESGDRECDLDAAVRLAGAIGHAAVLDLSRRWATTGGTGEAVRRPRLCAEGPHWAARCALDLVLAMFESYRRNRSAVETALEMFAR